MMIILLTFDAGSLKVSTNASISSLTSQGKDWMHLSTFKSMFWLSRMSLHKARFSDAAEWARDDYFVDFRF
jgi:hypothetical protein